METPSTLCELCAGPSSLYCASDSAFLCAHCDAKVHNANFLVASHVRQLLCSLCNGLSADFFSGSDSDHSLRRRPICTSCSPDTFSDCDDDDSLSSFSSSSKKNSDSHRLGKLRKISSYSSSLTDEDSTSPPPPSLDARVSGGSPVQFSIGCGGDSAARTKRRPKCNLRMQNVDEEAEGVFVNWSRKFGADGRAVASSASHALVICVGRLAGLPFRVSLAASFWFGLRMCGGGGVSTWQQLSRLEEISGVPAKTILAVQSKLTRALRVDLKEGWDECSA